MLKPAHGQFPSTPATPLLITIDSEIDVQPQQVFAHRWVPDSDCSTLELLVS